MGQQIRDKITPADCLAYADACESWAIQAKSEPARKRLMEMAHSWRELGRHLHHEILEGAEDGPAEQKKSTNDRLKLAVSKSTRVAGRRLH